MPDLFGGGGDQPNGAPVNIPINAIAPPWAKNMRDVSLPAGAPGQIGQLATQMSMGGFGNGGPTSNTANAAWLNSFYKPSPTSIYAPAPKPKPKPKVDPKVDPKVPPVGPSGHTRLPGGRNAR